MAHEQGCLEKDPDKRALLVGAGELQKKKRRWRFAAPTPSTTEAPLSTPLKLSSQAGRAPSLELLWALRSADKSITSGMRHLIATAAGELGRGRPEVTSDEFRTAASELAKTMGKSDRQVVRLRQACVDAGIFVETHPGTSDIPSTYRVARSALFQREM